MTNVGFMLLFFGAVAAITAEFILLSLAFKRSLFWFLGCLMFPLLWLPFFCLNPKPTAKPLGILLLGLSTAYVGCRLAGIEPW